jgi:hypothetical protein
MKTLLALLCLICLPFAARAQWTQGPTVLWRYQCDPAADGSAAKVDAFFNQTLTGPNGATTSNDLGSVSFDLVAKGATTVTAAGVTITYAQLAALNAAACAQEFAAKLTAKKP